MEKGRKLKEREKREENEQCVGVGREGEEKETVRVDEEGKK